jgi:hypothetical protein
VDGETAGEGRATRDRRGGGVADLSLLQLRSARPAHSVSGAIGCELDNRPRLAGLKGLDRVYDFTPGVLGLQDVAGQDKHHVVGHRKATTRK